MAVDYAAMLTRYEAIMTAIAETGQAYDVEGRRLTRADLPAVRETIDWIERKIAAADGKGRAVVVFKDPSSA